MSSQLWLKIFIIFSLIFYFADSLIGIQFSSTNNNNDSPTTTTTATCELSFHYLPFLTDYDWNELKPKYPFPCFNAIQHPNKVHFTLATSSNGAVYFTVIFAHWSTVSYKVSYLDPVKKEFTPMKTLLTETNCFGENSHITGLLNFQVANGTGRIRINSKTNGCNVLFDEDAFFSTSETLGMLKKYESRRPGNSMDENEATNIQFDSIYYPKRNPSYLLYSDSTYVYVDVPFNASNSPLFISGIYAIYKNSSFNIKANQGSYKYAMANITKPETPPWPNLTPTIYEWPNFDYIFDEEFFDGNLSIPGYQKITVPQSPKPMKQTSNVSTTTTRDSNGENERIISVMVLLILYVVFYIV